MDTTKKNTVFSETKENPLECLSLAEPTVANVVKTQLDQIKHKISQQAIRHLVEDTIWGLSFSTAFGKTISEGYIQLMEHKKEDKLLSYHQLIRKAGIEGPTLGIIMANCLVSVLAYENADFLSHFSETVNVMMGKGVYTLKKPFEGLTFILKTGESRSCAAYLDLLTETFRQELSYTQSQRFCYMLPKSVISFPAGKRAWQIKQLQRIIRVDHRLGEPFLQGMDKGLNLLSENELISFVSIGLEKYQKRKKRGKNFLSLESKSGLDTFSDMQVSISVGQVAPHLNSYLFARLGFPLTVRSFSSLPETLKKKIDSNNSVCSDGKFIYLPDEIDTYLNKEDNISLYKCLTKLEAGLYEFNTYSFDLEKILKKRTFLNDNIILDQRNISDISYFFSLFPQINIASDLFTIFEHGRLRFLSKKLYPGIIRSTLPFMQKEAKTMLKGEKPPGTLFLLYLMIALEITPNKISACHKRPFEYFKSIVGRFEEKMFTNNKVEACAEMILETYDECVDYFNQNKHSKTGKHGYIDLKTPFNRKPWPELYHYTHGETERFAEKIRAFFAQKGIRIFKSEINKQMGQINKRLSESKMEEALNKLLALHRENRKHGSQIRSNAVVFNLSNLDLSALFNDANDSLMVAEKDELNPTFWYKEWDDNIKDYLETHVRLIEKTQNGIHNDFYDLTLKRYNGLIKKIRYAFELLKPQGIEILRQWIEGDAFDYRAMIDFSIDKKAGITPSDKLYIKRTKQRRDVAVLLLVDLSRSTSNRVPNSKKSVLEVEKEAIILFCEALEVVGDTFAISGFSGTGRLGVDYYCIKSFQEEMDEKVKSRINGISPQRSTRMGAAIRHATYQLQMVEKKIRLLIILSDGFPNDVGYKQGYAFADTRKAILEARSKNIHPHAITVNITSDSRLDSMYGNVHHNIISNVEELPDKLLRVYNALTRN